MKKLFQKPTGSLLFSVGVFLLVPALLELMTHLFVYGGLSARIVYPILFSLAGGCLFFMLCSVLPGKAGSIAAGAVLLLVTLFFEVQFVYNSIFGEFMSLWQVTFGVTAITNFFRQLLYGIWKVLPQILLLLLPGTLGAVFFFLGKLRPGSHGFGYPLAALLLFSAFHFSAIGIMRVNDTGAFSARKLYDNVNTATEISVRNVGLLATTRLEASYLLFEQDAPEAEAAAYETEVQPDFVPEQLEPAQYNMIDLDFEALAQSTDNPVLKKLDNYFAAQLPTEKNEYTGIFSDCNLIVLCCESFSPVLIDEELTPALYRLSHEGFLFHNYYGSYGSNTTNGEYTLCMGLYPDLSRSKSTASFYASQANYLPYCLGNLFRERGAQAWAYHNYSGEYYSRSVTHPNMGYTFRSADNGLDIAINWPTSDLEMMEKSVDDYIDSGEPFVAYYMTFSGHYQYNWDNPMSRKNRQAVDGLSLSEASKAYIACNLELEYALQYLTDRLEQAGIADKTVIVLTNDHYPYGLTEQEYNELAGHEVDTTFEKYRNSFLCYLPGMQVDVDTYCSTVDILPTLLNLFGFSYDSRLLAGRDVLSAQADNFAVLGDQSFITEELAYDASTGTLRVFSEDAENAEQTAEALQKRIATRFQVSVDMLGSDYYAHALLGRRQTQSADEKEEDFPAAYAYTDIPNTFNLGALDYILENGYMEPMSDTKFGFTTPCTYAELLHVLYQISGSPGAKEDDSVRLRDAGSSYRKITGKYASAIKWAKNNGLIAEGTLSYMDSFTLLSRRDAALTLSRFGVLQGYDDSVTLDVEQAYEGCSLRLSKEERRAIGWCYENSVMRAGGSLESAYDRANKTMTREHVIVAIYNLYLRFAQ